jgi:hypothetical protein
MVKKKPGAGVGLSVTQCCKTTRYLAEVRPPLPAPAFGAPPSLDPPAATAMNNSVPLTFFVIAIENLSAIGAKMQLRRRILLHKLLIFVLLMSVFFWRCRKAAIIWP